LFSTVWLEAAPLLAPLMAIAKQLCVSVGEADATATLQAPAAAASFVATPKSWLAVSSLKTDGALDDIAPPLMRLENCPRISVFASAVLAAVVVNGLLLSWFPAGV
jgi:hypothetical protein